MIETETKTLEIDLVRAVRTQTLTTWTAATAAIHGLHQRDDEIARLRDEVARLNTLINMPSTDDFVEAVKIEAAHQIERWGVEHDAGKRAEDWITLYAYLLGKATRAHFDGNREKLLHHVITVAAVALNWHRNLTGENTAMRPGVAP